MLAGLPEHICGRNQSLEKDSQIFTTKADEFYVVVQRKSTAKYLKGNFTIKFIAFYLGIKDLNQIKMIKGLNYI